MPALAACSTVGWDVVQHAGEGGWWRRAMPVRGRAGSVRGPGCAVGAGDLGRPGGQPGCAESWLPGGGGGVAAANCCLLPEMLALGGLVRGLFIAGSQAAVSMALHQGAGGAGMGDFLSRGASVTLGLCSCCPESRLCWG